MKAVLCKAVDDDQHQDSFEISIQLSTALLLELLCHWKCLFFQVRKFDKIWGTPCGIFKI